eukprot:363847-Chlamydomonas_euryale.AAC.13
MCDPCWCTAKTGCDPGQCTTNNVHDPGKIWEHSGNNIVRVAGGSCAVVAWPAAWHRALGETPSQAVWHGRLLRRVAWKIRSKSGQGMNGGQLRPPQEQLKSSCMASPRTMQHAACMRDLHAWGQRANNFGPPNFGGLL